MGDDERVLVNHFYAQPVGHAIEALHRALGHHAADPERRRVSVALNAATPVELGALCRFVEETYAIEHPFVETAAPEVSDRALAGIPSEWDWVVDDGRRHHQLQRELFPGFASYYAASDVHLRPRIDRSVAGSERAGYRSGERLRLDVPDDGRRHLGGARTALAIMPAGSSPAAWYPSAASWNAILDALHAALPGVRLVLVGRTAQDERTATSIARRDLDALVRHPAHPIDAFDLALVEQLSLVQGCGAFLSPHTGFGMAALAVGTPWLALSGGRWFEWYFNPGVPFRSIVPDTRRFAAYSQFAEPATTADEDGARTPSMTRARIEADIPRIIAAAQELLDGRLTYEQAMADYVRDLVAAHDGDPSGLWSFENAHYAWLPAS